MGKKFKSQDLSVLTGNEFDESIVEEAKAEEPTEVELVDEPEEVWAETEESVVVEEAEEESAEDVQNSSESFQAKAQSIHAIVYSEPSAHSRFVRRLNAGNQMTVVSVDGDWMEISEPCAGFVRAKNVVRV